MSGAEGPAAEPSGTGGVDAPLPALEIDARGLICPAPIIALARRIAQVAVGQVLSVAAEDPAARYDVPAWCRMKGHDYLGESAADDGVPLYLVRRRQ